MADEQGQTSGQQKLMDDAMAQLVKRCQQLESENEELKKQCQKGQEENASLKDSLSYANWSQELMTKSCLQTEDKLNDAQEHYRRA